MLSKDESVEWQRIFQVNFLIFYATINLILSTNRFDEPLDLLWNIRCFSFYLLLYGYNFPIFRILIFTFSYYFFFIPGTHNSHVPGKLYFYVYCVNVHFHRTKKLDVP